MTTVADSLKSVESYAEEFELDLAWFDQRGEWGNQVIPGRRGLTLEDIQVGDYGKVPDQSDNMTGRPRGAVPRPDAFRVGSYIVRTKSDIWLANAAMLYEEALQRQWSSATDIPWHTIKPLPDDIERAECQLATFLTEVEFVAADVPGRWIANTTPDYFEPRMFLISQIMDEARHLDVFRKRALANGGGLMQRPSIATTSGIVGGIDMSRDFTEMSARLHISGEGGVLTIFRMGELMSYNQAEERIYRLAAQDESRHVAFGVMHLRYLSEMAPERMEEVHTYLDEGERGLLGAAATTVGGVSVSQNPAARDTPSNEALAVLLGGGKDHIDEGHNKLLAIRQRQVKEYVQRIRSAGFGERFENGRANAELMIIAQS